MTIRVILVSAAESEASATAAFDDGTPLTERGRAAADRLRANGVLPTEENVRARARRAPSPRCHETATLLGHPGALAQPALAGQDPGSWRGRPLDAVAAAEPAALSAWLSDPSARPGGDGEPLTALVQRVGTHLDHLADTTTGPLPLFVEPDTVRAALVHALGLPLPAYWRLDVRPLAVTTLVGHGGRWNLVLS
ncbi:MULTISPECIES: histidine phosphatase family protein [unclassified Streptomyces]|uniref:histidine phosphatase family protein n=1 Tax=unclassified Streptomyces TaxID=2593676 RepID=UPI0014390E4D|nr:histidine phosphatase family protein [Streptomyces sp. NEAU-H3]NJA57159.1 histidine phosphatase family protein [Streptomyces sp. NEAU-H3]